LVAVFIVALKVFMPDLFTRRNSPVNRTPGTAAKVRDSKASPDSVEPFAGSDVVVFTPSSVDTVWLQGFNGASYQIGVHYEWQLESAGPLRLSDPTNSVTSVTGLENADPGVYTIGLTVCHETPGGDDENRHKGKSSELSRRHWWTGAGVLHHSSATRVRLIRMWCGLSSWSCAAALSGDQRAEGECA
jgi:hypothetical protein